MGGLRSVLASATGAALLAVAAAGGPGPGAAVELLSETPLFQLVLARVSYVARAVYGLSGDPHIALYAAILFNNLTSALVFLSMPLVVRWGYEAELRSRRRRSRDLAVEPAASVRRRAWMVRASSIAVPSLVAFGMGASSLVSGPRLFMAVEMCAVLVVAEAVLSSPRVDSPDFLRSYLKLSASRLPVAVILLALAAAIEVSELLG
ncbi:MAG: hypothetical protein ABDH63_05795 [Candidatus Caldarchaeales archaeon]